MLRNDIRLHLERLFALVDPEADARADREGIQSIDVTTIKAHVRRTSLNSDSGSDVDQFGWGDE
jgi:hypothetical protein